MLYVLMFIMLNISASDAQLWFAFIMLGLCTM